MRTSQNALLYQRYQALAEATPRVHFVGRLATYRYYNMDQVVGQALTLYTRLAGLDRRAREGAARRGTLPLLLPAATADASPLTT